MNNKIRVIVRCIVDTNKKNSEKLQNTLEAKIREHWSSANLVLKSEERYWKYEDSTDVVYAIISKKEISVKEVISLFDVTWNYSCNNVFNIDTERSEKIEEALWSKNVHKEETFLLAGLTWVHVYTWEK